MTDHLRQSRLASVIGTLEEVQVFLARIDAAQAERMGDCIVSLHEQKSAEERIMDVLREHDGYFSGLYNLAVEARVQYRYAWDLIRDLEGRGLVELTHRSRIGKPIIVRLNHGS
jgi:hypothetical protein